MTERKCVFTGKSAKAKRRTLTKPQLNENNYHNWANFVPANKDYLSLTDGKPTTELEMQANELFHMLELARLRVQYYENLLEEVQKKINKTVPDKFTPKKPIKEKQIKRAYKEKAIIDEFEEEFKQDQKLNNNIWD